MILDEFRIFIITFIRIKVRHLPTRVLIGKQASQHLSLSLCVSDSRARGPHLPAGLRDPVFTRRGDVEADGVVQQQI